MRLGIVVLLWAVPLFAGEGTVLLVEDNAPVRELCRDMLTRAGYHVLLAAGGEEALLIHERMARGPDLLITDVLMPGIGGIALAEQLRARQSTLRVVFVSGHSAGAMDEAKARALDAVFLAKPFSMNDLCQALRVAQGPPARQT